MANGAKVALTGRIIKEPVQKTWKDSTVVSFSVDVNTPKKETTKDGERYVSDFYNISVWGASAEFILPRIEKGSLVQVYGDLTTSPYTKDGVEKVSLNVRAFEVIPLTPKKTQEQHHEPASDPDVPF